MGAQGSTEQGAPPPLVDENAIVGPEGGGRVRQVKIAGAGHPDVNGTYTLANDFAGAEMFEKFPGRGSSLGKLFIRRQSPDRLDTWVISLGLDAHSGCDDLFKREGVRKDQISPPTLGWEPCSTADGLPRDIATRLAGSRLQLQYYHGPLSDRRQSKPRGAAYPREVPQSPHLVVCIIGATDLPDTKAIESVCTCDVPGKSGVIESSAVSRSSHVEWRFKAPMPSWEQGDSLHFTMYDLNGESETAIGEVTLNYEFFRDEGFVGEVPLNLLRGRSYLDTKLDICVILPGQTPPGIEVELYRGAGGGHLGIEICPESSKDALSIRTIKPGGLIDKWNRENLEQRIKIRDRVIEINGKRGTYQDLIMSLAAEKDSRTIRMSIQRNI
mmetsp:Transcript_107045/g.290063  ORF Transcript_107045/g.290063 Transcript_107045/m.290063 type:complete len:384 (-) Transcript_107045:406-1557(-)